MVKKNIIIKIMENRLAPYGFKYAKYQDGRWTFSREEAGVKQNVVIQRIPGGKDACLEIDVDDYPLRIREITNNDPKYSSDFLSFKNEEDFTDVLNTMADIVIEYGIDKLNEKAKEKKAIIKYFEPTIQMYKKLYNESTSLSQQFTDRYHAADFTDEETIQLIGKELKGIQGRNYEEIQDKLVELASVYGNLLIKKLGGRWKYNKISGVTQVDITLQRGWAVLEPVIRCWQDGSIKFIKEEYHFVCDDTINWVKECRKIGGDDWKPFKQYAEWELPF